MLPLTAWPPKLLATKRAARDTVLADHILRRHAGFVRLQKAISLFFGAAFNLPRQTSRWSNFMGRISLVLATY